MDVGELIPDLWWMDKGPYSATCHPVSKIFTFIALKKE
jgi:hypothetical protein